MSEESTASPLQDALKETRAEPAGVSSDDADVPAAGELDVLTGLTPRRFEQEVADLWRARGLESVGLVETYRSIRGRERRVTQLETTVDPHG